MTGLPGPSWRQNDPFCTYMDVQNRPGKDSSVGDGAVLYVWRRAEPLLEVDLDGAGGYWDAE